MLTVLLYFLTANAGAHGLLHSQHPSDQELLCNEENAVNYQCLLFKLLIDTAGNVHYHAIIVLPA